MGYNMKVVIQWGKVTFGREINIWQAQGVYWEIFPDEKDGGRGVRKISAGGGVTSPPSRESPDKVANQFPNPADFATKNIFPADFKQKHYCFPATHCIFQSQSTRRQSKIIILKVNTAFAAQHDNISLNSQSIYLYIKI